MSRSDWSETTIAARVICRRGLLIFDFARREARGSVVASRISQPASRLRIVAGRWRGRRISAPKGMDVRPTLDRVREAWMSILQLDIPESRVLDLYAGSGALGLEALSRGASSADFVETDPRSLRALQDNIESLGAKELSTVHRKSALMFATALEPTAYDIVFADPPYATGDALRLAERWKEV